MRHITPARLDVIDTLLDELRLIDALKEKKRGVFYRKSRAFLHFHEDGDDIFADVRIDGPEFDRHRCTTRREQKDLVRMIRKGLGN